jgi:predicted Zn-dependent protease
MLVGCAHLYKTQIHDVVYLSDDQLNQNTDDNKDIQAVSIGGKPYVVNQAHYKNLKSIRNKVVPVTDKRMQFALVDSDLHTVLLLSRNGNNYVAMSFNFLNLFGDDEESLAAAMSHQYAHIVVGDDADVQDSREINYFLTKEIISTGVSLIATAAGGYGAGAAVDQAKRIADAKIEDQVNPMAITWLTNAGYTPCGYLKMQKVMERNSDVSSALTYLFTHPGIDERVKLSNDYLKANNLDCGDLESFARLGLIKKSGPMTK